MLHSAISRLRRTGGFIAGAALLSTAFICVPLPAAAYQGALSTTDGTIVGTGNWVVTGPTSLEWWVTQNPDASWHYKYVFSHPAGATSHFIVEASLSLTADDVFGTLIGFGGFTVGIHPPSSGNPGMPEELFGIKFDGTSGNVSTIEFDCTRRPVWGDFYSKDGTAGGYGINAAWNAGFTAGDQDPNDPPSDGSVGAHALVPDTFTSSPVRQATWGSVKAMYR